MRLEGVTGAIEAFDDIEDALSVRKRWTIGTHVYYAPFQELGTLYQSGTKHLRPGFDHVVNSFDTMFVATVEDAEALLDMVAFRIERETKLRAPVETGNLRGSYRVWKERL